MPIMSTLSFLENSNEMWKSSQWFKAWSHSEHKQTFNKIARALTVSPSMLCAGGCLVQGVPGLGGGWSWEGAWSWGGPGPGGGWYPSMH